MTSKEVNHWLISTPTDLFLAFIPLNVVYYKYVEYMGPSESLGAIWSVQYTQSV